MKACVQGYLGAGHSWSIVQQEITRQLIKKGHQVDLYSTNGLDHFPEDLKNYLKPNLTGPFDFQLSYTAPHNWPKYLPVNRAKNKKQPNRFGYWCYEFDYLPKGMCKYYLATDLILTPSSFTKDGFVRGGVPEDRVVIVPHGINPDNYSSKDLYPLKTKKSFKFLICAGQPHSRKGFSETFEAYFKAFTKKDNVCLVAKISTKKITSAFEVDVVQILKDLSRRYPNHPEVELITAHIPDINSLYNSCQAYWLASKAEGFGMPYLEAMAANKLVIATRYSGHLDFLNDKNSLLVDGKVVKADLSAQYWTPDARNGWFKIDMESAVSQLRKAVEKYNDLMLEFNPEMKKTTEKLTWSNVTDQIIGLIK